MSQANLKILVGEKSILGLDVAGDDALERVTITELKKQIEKILTNVEVVFVTAGLGGKTGTAFAPIVAEIAKKIDIITVGVVTKPFQVKKRQMKPVSHALDKLRQKCDTILVIDTNQLTKLAPQLPLEEAFKITNQLLANTIKGIIEMISAPNLISFDFTNFKALVKHGGVAVVGIGESNAPNRAEEAVRNALKNPLLNVDLAKVTGALIHVTGDNRMTIEEANHVREIVAEMMKNNSQVIWGARVDPEFDGKIRVTLVITGVNSSRISKRFELIAPQLFNLEPYSEPEKKLPVDLGLYQLESF